MGHLYIKFSRYGPNFLEDKRFYNESHFQTNHSMHMKHSSTLQHPVRLAHQQNSGDKTSDESQPVGTPASGIGDYKRDSKHDWYADRLGSPKRMR